MNGAEQLVMFKYPEEQTLIFLCRNPKCGLLNTVPRMEGAYACVHCERLMSVVKGVSNIWEVGYVNGSEESELVKGYDEKYSIAFDKDF